MGAIKPLFSSHLRPDTRTSADFFFLVLMRRLLTVAAEGRNTNIGTIEMNGTSTTRGVPGAHALERRRASPVATRRSHGTTFVLFGDWR